MAEQTKPTKPPAGDSAARAGVAADASWRTSWQLPAMVLSAGLVLAGVVAGVLTKPKADVAGMLETAREAVAAESYDDALKYLNEKVRPYLDGGVLTAEQGREFHLLRARAVALAERRLGVRTAENATTVIEELKAAEELGAKLEPRDTLLMADALVTLGKRDKALQLMEELPEESRAARSQVVKRIVEQTLEDAKADVVPSLRLLAELLSGRDLAPADRAWAVARQGELLLKQAMPEAAVARLLQVMPGLIDTAPPESLGDLHRVLGRAYFESGALTEAGKRLEEAARHFLESDPRWASTQALLARLDELTGEPARARQRYQAVLERVDDPAARLPALLGLAEVRDTLGEAEEAAKDFEQVVSLLSSGTRAEGVTPASVSKSLLERSRTRYASGDTARALRYAELAERASTAGVAGDSAEVPPEVLLAVAAAHRRAADELLAATRGEADRLAALARLDPATREQSRVHLVTAGRAFKRHADSVGTLDNAAYGDSLWSAADAMDLSGDQELSIPLLADFVRFFPADPRLPEARFRLGQAYQARGDYATAAEQFRALMEGEGNQRSAGEGTAFADRAAVPLAQCLLLDQEQANDAEAESILTRVVSGRAGAVGIEQRREALVVLAGLRRQRGDWAGAIQLLEEAAQRAGDWAGAVGVWYDLAEAHRRDAAAILRSLEEAMPDQQRATLTKTRGQRLERAAELYDKVRETLDGRDARRMTRLDRLQLRNACFYLGECAFARGDYEEAIRRYDAARERYPEDPASLVALMQIVNAYVELGDLERARAAQARARRFYEGLPPTAWEDPDLPMTKSDWQRWLDSMTALRPLGGQAAAGTSKETER